MWLKMIVHFKERGFHWRHCQPMPLCEDKLEECCVYYIIHGWQFGNWQPRSNRRSHWITSKDWSDFKNWGGLTWLFVMWNNIFIVQEDSMARIAISYWKFENEIWRMSYGYAELWSSRYAKFFGHVAYKCKENFLGRPKTVSLQKWHVLISCETFNAM